MVDMYTMWALGHEAEIERKLRELADRFSDANVEVANRLVEPSDQKDAGSATDGE